MFQIAIIAASIAVTTQSQAPLPCLAPPSGANKVQVNCVSQACNDYVTAWNECETPTCRSVAWLMHGIAVADCVESFNAHEPLRESWITIWYTPDGAGTTYDGKLPSGTVAYFQF